MEKNSYKFGKLLEKLIQISNQKNYALANALGYDVSYISKWISGSILPANKSATTICHNIAKFIVGSSNEIAIKKLAELYGEEDEQLLTEIIYEKLMEAYQSNSGKNERDNYILTMENNAKVVVNPRLQKIYLDTASSKISDRKKLEIIMIADLFSLGKEDKLGIASVETESIVENIENKNNIHIHYLISLNRSEMDIVFDTILLINMLTNYADIDFQVFNCKKAPCSILFAIRDQYMHMSVISENHRAIVSSTSMDKNLANEMFDTMVQIEKSQSSILVDHIDVEDFIENKLYMHSIISPDIRWLIGRMNELLLPIDIFENCVSQIDKDDLYKEQLRRLNLMLTSALDISNIRIIIYDSAFCEYVLNGELDFYGEKIKLNLEQRRRHIEYIRDIFTENSNLELYIVAGNFVNDFKNCSNPCVYLSSNIQYLRLNRDNGESLFRVIRDRELKNVFDDFYEAIWTIDNPIVIRDKKSIEEKIDNYLNMLTLLGNGKQSR